MIKYIMVKTIYIMYEIEEREFLSRLFFASELSKSRSLETHVQLFQHSLLGQIACISRPGIMIIKSCPKEYLPYLETMKKRGFLIILSQEEGIHYSKELPDQLEFAPECSKYIDHYFACHPEDAYFANRMGIPMASISICGNLRLQLASMQRNFTPCESPNLLILENFSSHKSYEINLRRLKNKHLDLDFSKRIKLLSLTSEVNLLLYKSLYQKLKKGNIQYVVRKYSLEIDLTSKKSDIKKKSNILEDFQGKNIVIHYGSTGGLESILAGKISLVLASKKSRIHDKRIYNISECFESDKEILRYLKEFNPEEISFINSDQLNKVKLNYGIDFLSLKTSNLMIKVISELNFENFVQSKEFLDRFAKYLLYVKGLLAIWYRKHLTREPFRVMKSSKLTNEKLLSDFQFLKIDYSHLAWKISRNGKKLKVSW